jgi:hypothetical protein
MRGATEKKRLASGGNSASARRRKRATISLCASIGKARRQITRGLKGVQNLAGIEKRAALLEKC